LVSPQEAERLALASHAGSLRLAMRNYNDNKIVLTSGSDVAQMLRAYSLAPDVPVMAAQPEHHAAVAAPRRKAIEVEILRNGKSSESVSFVNEAAADSGSAKPARHARKAVEPDDDESADAGSDATTAVASAPASVEHHDTATAPTPADIKPAGASSSAMAVGYVPTPKTIDIP
jgi:hypothetical protein